MLFEGSPGGKERGRDCPGSLGKEPSHTRYAPNFSGQIFRAGSYCEEESVEFFNLSST